MKKIAFAAMCMLASAMAAGPDARAQEGRLIMGVFPGAEMGQTESYEILDRYMPFAEYLTANTGSKVIVLPVAKGAERAMKEMIEGKGVYKLFFGPPVFAAEAIEKAGFVPVVVEQERIRAVFIVKESAALRSLGDIKETTRVAMPSSKLLLAILASETLAQSKLPLKPDGRQHINSIDGMMLALESGIADAAVIGDRAVKKLMAEKPFPYRAIGQSVDAPGFALIAHRSVSDDRRAKLRQAAVALNKDPSPLATETRARLRTGAFAAARDDEFQALQGMMARWAH